MADQGNMKHFPFDWSSFEKHLNEQLSALSEGPAGRLFKDNNWIGSLMQDVMKKAAPSQVAHTFAGSHSEVFETHGNVFVRLKLPENANPRAIQVYIAANSVKLDGLPGGRSQIIRLPVPVLPKSGKATYKNGVLQIQMRKSGDNEKYHETYVSFL